MTTTATPVTRATRFLRTVEGFALLYGAIAGGMTLMTAFVVLSSSFTPGGGSAISLPVAHSPATITTELENGVGHFTMVEFTATGLSPLASLLYFAPRVLIPLLHSIIAFAIARFALGARKERPFNDGLSSSIRLIAWSVAILGTLSQMAFSYGTSLASFEFLSGTGLSGYVQSTGYDWIPILVSLGLFAVVIVLRAGERLQRDTEGLV